MNMFAADRARRQIDSRLPLTGERDIPLGTPSKNDKYFYE